MYSAPPGESPCSRQGLRACGDGVKLRAVISVGHFEFTERTNMSFTKILKDLCKMYVANYHASVLGYYPFARFILTLPSWSQEDEVESKVPIKLAATG